MKERRRSRRVPVEGMAGVLKFSSDAQILNLSLTGMAVRTGAHLAVGHRTDVRLGSGESAVRLSATVVWSKLVGFEKNAAGEAAPVYEAGFEFESVLSEQAHNLLALMGDRGAITPETRLAGRFEMPGGETADLQSAGSFLVKVLSASGLLIETESTLAPESVVGLELSLEGETVRARARVVHVQEPLGAPGIHQAGLEFVDLSEKGTRLIASVLDAEPEPGP